MLDPLILRIISLGFALLFMTAALHKFGDKPQFRGILEAYQILPSSMLGFAVNVIPVVELLLGVAWILSGLLFLHFQLVPLLSAMLLSAYTLSIGINLLRGRSYIDCGCGFSSMARSAKNRSDTAGIQQLSSGLLLRNCTLIATALITVIPPTLREMVFMDYLSLVTATVAFVLLYGAFNQLLANHNAIGAWRNTSSEDSHG